MTASTAKTLLLGHTVRFIGNPFKKGVDAAVRTDSQGGILMSGGKIEAIGTGHDLRSAHPQAKVIDYCWLLDLSMPMCIIRKRPLSPVGANGLSTG